MSNIQECLICSLHLQIGGTSPFLALENDSETFLYRNILNISKSTLSKVLLLRQEDSYNAPYYCSECHSDITKAEKLFYELINLKTLWENLTKSLMLKIQESSKKQKRKPGPKSIKRKPNIIEMIRNDCSDKRNRRFCSVTFDREDQINESIMEMENDCEEQNESCSSNSIKVECDSDGAENSDELLLDSSFETENPLYIACKYEDEDWKPGAQTDFDGNLSSGEISVHSNWTKSKHRKSGANFSISSYRQHKKAKTKTFSSRPNKENSDSYSASKSLKGGQSASEVGEYPCDFCPKLSKTLATKKQHEQYAHNITHEFKCDNCQKCLANGYTLLRHIQSVHKQNTNIKEVEENKPECKVQSWSANSVRSTGGVDVCTVTARDFNCTENETLDVQPESVAVIPDSLPGKYPCQFCSNVSKTLLKKKVHESRAHDVKHTFQCEKCNKCLANGYTLIRHIKSVHQNKKKRKPRTNTAKISKTVSSSPNTMKCDESVVEQSTGFTVSENMDELESTENESIILQDSELGEYACQYCPNVSKTLLKRKLHESRTHGVRHTFQCKKCKRCLANGYTLLRHIQSVHIRKKTRAKKYKKRDYRDIDVDVESCESSLVDDMGREGDENASLVDLLSGKIDLTSIQDCQLGIHNCDHCSIISSTRLKKMEHERRAHGVAHKFQCKSCQKCLANGYTLLRHIISVHVDKKARSTSYKKADDVMSINAKAARKVRLKYNTLRNGSGVFKCQHCGKLCSTMEKKNDHENRAHGENHKFLCEHCSKFFLTSYTLERHVFDIHPATVTGHSSVNAYESSSHVIIFRCETCGQICKSAAKLAQHVRKIHEANGGCPRSFLCQQCGKSFPSLWDLRNHEYRVHNIDVPFPCKLCKRSYTTDTKLQGHVLLFHDGNQVPAECSQCNKKFPNKTALRKHSLRIHCA